MTDRKGHIKVQTGDIFPIIKKWLYSEHDIFIRELVANATDAITKRATLALGKNLVVSSGEIKVSVDKTKKTLTIEDNGLGMTEEEVEKYLAQLAFSGAEEFVKKMKDQGTSSTQDIIGKFGLGFYSVFMVSKRVEVESLSFVEGSTATKWSCEGETDYTFSESDKSEVGTKITLFINEESEDFLNTWKISETLRKFCDFLPYPISVFDLNATEEEGKKGQLINETKALWKKDAQTLTDQDYKDFYKKLYPMDEAPLFWLHLKVEHPFNLEGVLYFPKINMNRPYQERNIKLYNKQMFVSDNVKDVIPDFLVLLKGAIDSSDIPLNVSRSSLQGDPNVKKISNYIVKKVAEALKKLFNSDRPRFETIWEDIQLFVKYGCVQDPKFYQMMQEYILFKSGAGKLSTLNEYQLAKPEKFQEKLKDKIIYFEKGKSDAALRKQLEAQGIPTVETDEMIDPHFTQNLEMHGLTTEVDGKEVKTNFKFVSVDEEFDSLMETDATTDSDVKIKELFAKYVAKSGEGVDPVEVEMAKIKGATSPAYFKVDAQMKRFAQMAKSMNMGGMNKSMPVKKTLMVNPGNSLVMSALRLHESGKETLVEKICHHVADLAHISSEGLSNEEKESFVTRSQELISELAQGIQ